MPFDIDSWYNDITCGDVIIHHQGAISADLITNMLVIAEEDLQTREPNRKVRKKIYNVLVEALQNLYHHSTYIPDNKVSGNDKNYAVFALSKIEKYKFTCGNYVLSEHVKILKKRIDEINSLTAPELKVLYQSILNNNEYSEKGGGGLGFVDMARRAGCKYIYEFHEISEGFCFFTLDIIVAGI